MSKVKAWKIADPEMPYFPASYEIVRKAVLQVTDIKTNRNKYYAIELHAAEEDGQTHYRVFTHYGRTDDLETNPESGQKECRFFTDAVSAEANYTSIYRQKTSPTKGYKELSLASSKIGSQLARGTSAGEVDAETLDKIKAKTPKKKVPAKASFDLDVNVRDLVTYLFSEATNALTSTLNAKITANGIETPLGILTLGQIRKGEAVLTEAYEIFNSNKTNKDSLLEQLSGEFYTIIPHRIGRTREAVARAVINSIEAFAVKTETLQLMQDMLQVDGEGDESVLYHAQIENQYQSLNTELTFLSPSDDDHRRIAEYVKQSQIKTKNIRVKSVYRVKRKGEDEKFTHDIDNQRELFHGSRIQNWVGMLSRGILMPKLVIKLGVNRTDAGWLGNGIYFGDAACTSAFYTSAGKRKTRFMAVAKVALGKMKDFTKITYGIEGPPPGYHSCHGVRRTSTVKSQFDDDEYVIYSENQQRMDYLVEFTV